ncbi:MAG: Gfo/Idh/MocA family oxidoreductase [Acidobacteria bacterium]|nr:Gfo/Idh/MocA family oxidoreductase [Acidobacteriota bacterium]
MKSPVFLNPPRRLVVPAGSGGGPPLAPLAALLLSCAAAAGADLRLGIVGADTSHVIAFTRTLNDPSAPEHVAGARVVAAFKGGSPDLPSSRDRVDKFTEELRSRWGLEIVPDIATLCKKVDAVLLESVDGRKHLEQAKEIIACRKPMFIDKPLASTLEDAREIARLAKAAGVPWFSSSSLRFGEIGTTMKFDDAVGAATWGPGPLEATHKLDLSWYAIHPIEMLYALLGPGCQEVTRTYTERSDEVTCRWKDGKIGSVRALRPYGEYGAVVFRAKQVVQSPPKARAGYAPLLREVVKFFQTGKPPVSNEETLEIFAFMDAAQRSREAGGKPMTLR